MPLKRISPGRAAPAGAFSETVAGPEGEPSLPGAGAPGKSWVVRQLFQHPGRALLAVVLLFAISFSLTACYFFQRQRRATLEGAREELESIANLKASQLANWCEERQNDADLLSGSFLTNRLQVFLTNSSAPNSTNITRVRFGMLDQLQKGGYERIVLLDPQLQVRYSAPRSEEPLDPAACALAGEALRTGQIRTEPIHFAPQTTGVYLDIAVPRFVDGGTLPQANEPAGPPQPPSALIPAGALLLRANVKATLFPSVQSWPYPSRSAEAQLVRRERGEVVYLTSSRFQPPGIVPLHRSVQSPDLVAAMAARGQKGTFFGKDVRGVPVMATARPIPGLGCLLVVKIDQQEIYARLHALTLAVAITQVMLGLTTMLGVGLAWRERENHFARRKLEAQKQTTAALRQSAERLRGFTNASFEGIVVSEAGCITDTNDQYLQMLGLEREAVVGRSILDFIVPQARPAVETSVQNDSEAGYESRLLRSDGGELEVEIRPRVLYSGGRKTRIAAVRDITERQRQQRELHRLNRLYQVLSRVNNAVLHTHTRNELFNEVCCAAVENGGFGMTWVAWLAGNGACAERVAVAGREQDPPEQCKIVLDERPESQEPVGSVLRTGEPFIANDLLAEPRLQAWHEWGRARGFQALGSFPLRLTGHVRGALIVHACEKDFFQAEEIQLLREIGMDVSYALDRFELETERQRMETALRQAQKMEAIGNLAAGIAHEINTPVQFTEHNLQFLQETCPVLLQIAQVCDRLLPAAKTGPLPPDLIERLEQIADETNLNLMAREIPAAIQESLRGAERIRKIVLAMKEFSHPGTGKFDRPEPTNLNRALENTITVARNEWKYVAELVRDFDPALPQVAVYPGEFNQVVLNLLVNAAQAIAEAQRAEPGRKGIITMSTRREGGWVEVRVRDNGAGIPQAIRHRLFELFFTTKEVGKGTGQGLALAHAIIVERHHGAITFESEPGQGTCFIVRLPLTPDAGPRQASQ